MAKLGGRTGRASSAMVASAVLLAMVTSLSAAAPASAVVAKLGYNTIQLQNPGADDPNSNFDVAKNTGMATWFRGGPGMPEDTLHQDAYVFRADQAGLKVLYVIPDPGTDIDNDGIADVPSSYNGYQTYCHNLSVNKSYVDAFDIMNEANGHMDAPTYAQYLYYCEQGIRSDPNRGPNFPILAASTWRGHPSPDGLSSGDWLRAVSSYTRYSAPDWIISSHIYPDPFGSDLDSPQQAASLVKSKVADDLNNANALGNQNHGLWITETGVRDDWLNSARPSIGLNQVCAPAYKPEYLRQMFLKAGDNNTYDVPKVFIYRFTRAQHGDSSNWNTAGVYDSHPDPNVPNHPEYGSSDCGMAALASAAGPFGPD